MSHSFIPLLNEIKFDDNIAETLVEVDMFLRTQGRNIYYTEMITRCSKSAGFDHTVTCSVMSNIPIVNEPFPFEDQHFYYIKFCGISTGSKSLITSSYM